VSATPQTIDSTAKARAAIVDEFGEISQKMALWAPPMNPHAQRFAELQLQILSWYQNEPAEKKFIAEGTRFRVPVKARKLHREVINIPKLLKIWGMKRIAELWEPPLNVVEREIPKDKHSLYILEECTGNRALGTPVLIHPEAA
jgi:hypothetical protein